MGMYDTIKFNKTLPDGVNGRETDLQTKDLDCNLDIYDLTEGKLIDEEGNTKKISGEITLCTIVWDETDEEGQRGWWHEYTANFKDGHLLSIVSIESGTPIGFD